MSSVIVVGAGIAGLHCARVLNSHGYHVTILEKSDRVGGRMKTDVVDGFRLDHGFQVINPAYSELEGFLHQNDLDIKSLPKGFEIRIGQKDFLVGDFRKSLRYLPADLSGKTGSIREKLEFLRFILRKPSDEPFQRAMEKCGTFYREVMKGFLDGVFLTDSDAVSSRVAHELLRWFVLGSPGIPALGVEELPKALAHGLDVRLNCEVTKISDHSIDSSHGSFDADFVVIACDPNATQRFVGVEEVRTNYSVTWYHHVPAGLIHSAHLKVLRNSPFINSVAISNVAPSYAPPGFTLLSSTTLHEVSESEARSEIARAWNIPEQEMTLIRAYGIHDSLPFHGPGKPLAMPQRISKRVFVAGDFYAIPAQQGAMASGRRAAELVIAAQ